MRTSFAAGLAAGLVVCLVGALAAPPAAASEEEPCDAEVRQKAEAEAARKARFLREGSDAAAQTVRDARAIAEGYWTGSREVWIETFSREAEAWLRPRTLVPDLDVWVTGDACRAIATRDEAACLALPVERERDPCRAAVLFERELARCGRDCACFPDWMRGGCAGLLSPETAACDEVPEAAREGCRVVKATLLRARDSCGTTLVQSDCFFASALLVVRDGEAACDLASGPGGARDPSRVALDAACRAVATREPRRCPSAGLGERTGAGAYARAAVLPGREGPFALVGVASDSPAACHVSYRVTGRVTGGVASGAPPLAEGTRVVEVRSWQPRFVSVPVPPETDVSTAIGDASALCVPWFAWD